MVLIAGLVSAADGPRERREATTGSRILPPVEVVFGVSPIQLTGAVLNVAVDQRLDITFILDPSLKVATTLFQAHPNFKTDDVVTHVESLDGVRQYIASSSGPRFGVINIVAHGSPQTGLDVPIVQGGASASVHQLLLSKQADVSMAHRIDSNTEIRIYGCGVGADPKLVSALDAFFAGSKPANSPTVYALEEFIEFADEPTLRVSLRQGLTSIGRSRMEVYRSVREQATAAGIELPYAWKQHLKTEPMVLKLDHSSELGQPVDARSLAAANSRITSELNRLQTDVTHFNWRVEDDALVGRAVIGWLTLDADGERQILDNPESANWLASK